MNFQKIFLVLLIFGSLTGIVQAASIKNLTGKSIKVVVKDTKGTVLASKPSLLTGETLMMDADLSKINSLEINDTAFSTCSTPGGEAPIKNQKVYNTINITESKGAFALECTLEIVVG